MKSMMPRALLLPTLVLFALSAFGLSGCGELTEFENEFDTEFTIPKPEKGAFGLKPYTKKKRFKFDSDPADAEWARLQRAGLTVLAPEGSDLSFLNRLEVFVEEADGTLVPLASAEDFAPNETQRNLTIDYDDDLRPFVRDQRVHLTWVAYPSNWSFAWPADGITIRTDVTMRIKADVF